MPKRQTDVTKESTTGFRCRPDVDGKDGIYVRRVVTTWISAFAGVTDLRESINSLLGEKECVIIVSQYICLYLSDSINSKIWKFLNGNKHFIGYARKPRKTNVAARKAPKRSAIIQQFQQIVSVISFRKRYTICTVDLIFFVTQLRGIG